MPLSAKERVQKFVKDALRIPYQKKEVSKEQYTEINRSVSRMLYDKIGDSGNLTDDTADLWQKLASDEVAKAIDALPLTDT
jgi:hypothetical protein